MYGWEIVCPPLIGRAASSYARRRSRSRTNRSRGTASIARSTRSSTMSRPRSCAATIERRRRACSSSGGICEQAGVGRRLDAEVLECERGEVDDAARRRRVETDGEDGHLGVGGCKGAVTPAAQVALAAEVVELDAFARRDQ